MKNIFVKALLEDLARGVHAFDDDAQAMHYVNIGAAIEVPPHAVLQRCGECGQSEPVHHPKVERPDPKRRVSVVDMPAVQEWLAMLAHPVIAEAVRTIASGKPPLKPEQVVAR